MNNSNYLLIWLLNEDIEISFVKKFTMLLVMINSNLVIKWTPESSIQLFLGIS